MPKKRDPRARFEEDAPARGAAAVRAIRALRKLAGPGGKPEEWGRIFSTLEKEMQRLRDAVAEMPAHQQMQIFDEPPDPKPRPPSSLDEVRKIMDGLGHQGPVFNGPGVRSIAQTPHAPSGADVAAPDGSSAS